MAQETNCCNPSAIKCLQHPASLKRPRWVLNNSISSGFWKDWFENCLHRQGSENHFLGCRLGICLWIARQPVLHRAPVRTWTFSSPTRRRLSRGRAPRAATARSLPPWRGAPAPRRSTTISWRSATSSTRRRAAAPPHACGHFCRILATSLREQHCQFFPCKHHSVQRTLCIAGIFRMPEFHEAETTRLPVATRTKIPRQHPGFVGTYRAIIYALLALTFGTSMGEHKYLASSNFGACVRRRMDACVLCDLSASLDRFFVFSYFV